MLALVVVLLGCGETAISDPPPLPRLPDLPAEPAPLSMDEGGTPSVRLLEHLGSARLTLPDSSLPEGVISEETVLRGPWREDGPSLWSAPSPTRLFAHPGRSAPAGIELRVTSQVLPYLASAPPEVVAWSIQGARIVVRSRMSPEGWGSPPVLRNVPARAEELRLNRETAELPDAEFAAHVVTLAGQTRPSLLLPAPGEARFTVEVPRKATLRFAVGIAPGAVQGDDKAEAAFSVWAGKRKLWEGTARGCDPWQDVSVDLSRYGGDTVELRFATDPKGDPSRDYAAFANPELVGKPREAPRRILVVDAEGLRPDHLGALGYNRPTTPFLDQLAAQSVVFTDAWAAAPRAAPSVHAAVTGRWPHAAGDAATTAGLLSAAGWTTAGIAASEHLSSAHALSSGYHRWDLYPDANAEDQVERALAWLKEHEDEDSYLFVHFADAQTPYQAPPPYRDRFTSGLDQGDAFDTFTGPLVRDREAEAGPFTEVEREWMEARYDGEVAYLDAQLARLVEESLALPGETLLVVMSDHGQEFWEHGSFGGGHTLHGEAARALLLVRPPAGWPGGPRLVDSPVSLVDLAPTLLDIAGAKGIPEMDGVSLRPYLEPPGGEAALASALEQRPILLGHTLYGGEQWGVILGDSKYLLHNGAGSERIFDLSADRSEQTDLAVQAGPEDLARWHAALAEATGWAAGPGWRVVIQAAEEPFSLTFDEPVRAAGVLDPDASSAHRADRTWGERPLWSHDDVARVTLSDDGRTVRIEPGAAPDGVVYLLGPSPTSWASLRAEGRMDAQVGPGPLLGLVGPESVLEIQPGTIIAPQLAADASGEVASAR